MKTKYLQRYMIDQKRGNYYLIICISRFIWRGKKKKEQTFHQKNEEIQIDQTNRKLITNIKANKKKE